MNPFRQFASDEDSGLGWRLSTPDKDVQKAVGQDADHEKDDPQRDGSHCGRNQSGSVRGVRVERNELKHSRNCHDGNHGPGKHCEELAWSDCRVIPREYSELRKFFARLACGMLPGNSD